MYFILLFIQNSFKPRNTTAYSMRDGVSRGSKAVKKNNFNH